MVTQENTKRMCGGAKYIMISIKANLNFGNGCGLAIKPKIKGL